MRSEAVGGDLDVRAIRSRFPALERRHEGGLVGYFDGPGGTQVPREVVEAMDDYLFHHNANTHWAYPSSAETDEGIEDARRALADFVNGDSSEIAFGANMSTLTFHLSRALGRSWGAGDEIVVTELDHHANVDSWRALERERGVTIRTVRLRTETGRLDADELDASIGRRTRLLAIGLASNALGTINDVPRAVAAARAAGALVFVDAVHSAPHVLTDVRKLDCDFLACSAYKFYGPHIGVLWGRRRLLAGVDFPKLEPAPSAPPENAETGTQNHEGIAGAAAAVAFLASLGGPGPAGRRAALERAFARLEARGSVLFARLWAGLRAIPGVTLYGPPPDEPRTPTVSFVIEGVPSEEVARSLARRALFLSSGDFYAWTVVKRLGHERDGLVRAGCACYTTEDEVDRLIAGVREIAAGERPVKDLPTSTSPASPSFLPR